VSEEREHFRRRVAEEVAAALASPSLAATIVHLRLATGYARRCGRAGTGDIVA
jgi:hypothetical protein